MSERQRCRHVAGNAHRFVDRELALTPEPVTQRFAFDIRHEVVQQPIGLIGVDQRHDVRVGEPGGDVDLPVEALDAEAGGELGMEHLHGHGPGVLPLLRQEHRRHTAPTQPALHGVAVPQCSLQTGQEQVGQTPSGSL